MKAFTLFHVVISLIGIFSGFLVVGGLLSSRLLPGWTKIFLWTTTLTSVTGFLFPVAHFLPSHAVGILSLVVLAFALVALYPKGLRGPWRWVYAVTAILALYLNCFVLVVQLFLKVPALHALAPTGSETPFAITQASSS
jgi:hypothetical protein